MRTMFFEAALAALLVTGTVYGASDDLAAISAEVDREANELEQEKKTASEILLSCSQLIPTERLLLTGTLKVKKLRGFILQENPYKLMLDWGANPPNAELMLLDPGGTSLVQRAVMTRKPGAAAELKLFSGPEQKPEETPNFAGRVSGTDLTWLDLSLDFLWWKDARFDTPARGESRNGRDCHIIIAGPPKPIPGCSAVRVWVDRQLHCIMQAEQIGPQGDTVRRMWVQRVKKMNDRWMIRDMEVSTLNSNNRTQLLVEDVATP